MTNEEKKMVNELIICCKETCLDLKALAKILNLDFRTFTAFQRSYEAIINAEQVFGKKLGEQHGRHS